MVRLLTSAAALALLALGGPLAAADATQEQRQDQQLPFRPSVLISTTFGDEAPFGLQLVNNHATRATITVTNHEDESVDVDFIDGMLWPMVPPPGDAHPSYWILRNLTATRYGATVEPGEVRALPYSFVQDMQPRDVRLELSAVVSDVRGNVFRFSAYNGTAAVVEAPTSLLDPQILFLYFFLACLFGSVAYWIYNTWVRALFPKTRDQRPGPRSVKSSASIRKTGIAAEGALSGSESGGAAPFVTSKGGYDQSWIPDHHINKPVARRVKSGASLKKKAADKEQ